MTYLPDNLAELWLGDLLLTGETTDDNGATFTIDALDEDATWANPVPVDTAVERWKTDGAVAATLNHTNREVYFKVKISAATSAELAGGEAALVKRSNRPAKLTWTPPEGAPDAPPAVFEVWTWHLEHIFDGTDERHLSRMYGMRLTTKPWTRSDELTIAEATDNGGTPTVVSIDPCTSLTGWTGSPNAPTLVSSTSVREARTVPTGGGHSSELSAWSTVLTRTGAVSGMTTTPYLMVDVKFAGGTNTLLVKADGTPLTKVATLGTTTWWQMPAGVDSFTTLEVNGAVYTNTVGATVSMAVSDVSRTDTVGGIGSRKQLFRTVEVGGSVPTSGSIQIASPDSTGLGTVLVYTSPDRDDGYSPPLRQYHVSGNSTSADSSAVSGFHEVLIAAGLAAGPVLYQAPASQYREGTYAVLGRFVSDAASTLTATLGASVSGTTIEGTTSGKVTWASADANKWQWGVMGVLHLPPRAVAAGTANNITFTLTATGTGSANIVCDELWLLDITHGDLSLIDTGTGQTSLWLDAPDADPERNRPAVYTGTAADRSNAMGVLMSGILALGDHDLDPDGAALFTVTDGVANAAVTASFYRRWHTHPGS